MQPLHSAKQNEEYVDLRGYLAILRRRAPVILGIAAICLGLAFAYTRLQTPIYTSTARVLLKPPPGNTVENLSNVISVETEAQVVKSEVVAVAASETLDTTLEPLQLLKRVSVQTTPGSFIMAISFSSPDPERAALGANAFAEAYISFRRKEYEDQIASQERSIEAQMHDLQREQTEQNQILEENPPGTIAYRTAQDALSQLSIRLAVLASALSELPQVVDTGQVILSASVPVSPSSPNVQLNLAIGLLLGVLAGVGAALVAERMDDRVHDSSELYRFTDAPVLAYVPHTGERKKPRRSTQLVVRLQPHSPAAEAYRTVRTGILSMAQRRGLVVIAFVSPVQGEGKSMTCANIAAALGQTGRRVLAISVDIRRPTLHEFLGVPNELGLTEVLAGEVAFGEAVQRSEMGGIWLLSGGQQSSEPAELLQSPAMGQLLTSVRDSFDFVILDCPPILGLADSLSILPLADATLLVVAAGRTQGGALVEANERLARVGVAIEGAIVNDVRIRRGHPGHRAYGYYRSVAEYLDVGEPRQGVDRDDQAVRTPRRVVSKMVVGATSDANGSEASGQKTEVTEPLGNGIHSGSGVSEPETEATPR